MFDSQANNTGSPLVALGAGDLIDRAVRFYRKNFWTMIMIAAPPVVAGTLFSVGWTILGREMFSAQAAPESGERVFYYFFLWLGNVCIWLIEMIATLVVMGGASRNFVRHILFGEAITFGNTYRNTYMRLGSLVASSSVLVVLVGFVGLVLFYFGMIVATFGIIAIVYMFSAVPVVAAIVSIVFVLGVIFATLFLFSLIASRFAYVPQVMLVEGQGAFAAIARSASLASGNVRRIMALFVFSMVATYSALALLYVPLGWYAWANGVEIMTFGNSVVPAWYEISNSLIGQLSFILLSPVWMIGLCLLYVDDRVRSEGYDIELMAASRLGEIPTVPSTYVNPLQPALAAAAVPIAPVDEARSTGGFTTLGLK